MTLANFLSKIDANNLKSKDKLTLVCFHPTDNYNTTFTLQIAHAQCSAACEI